MIKRIGVLLCLGLSLSCATMPPGGKVNEADIQTLIRTINSGDSALLTDNLATPFLLDTEIITLNGDIQDFWNSLLAEGFTLPDAEIQTMQAITPTDSNKFGTSSELEIFFRKYIPPTARLVTLVAENRIYLLIIEPGGKELPLIHGFKGPVI